MTERQRGAAGIAGFPPMQAGYERLRFSPPSKSRATVIARMTIRSSVRHRGFEAGERWGSRSAAVGRRRLGRAPLNRVSSERCRLGSARRMGRHGGGHRRQPWSECSSARAADSPSQLRSPEFSVRCTLSRPSLARASLTWEAETDSARFPQLFRMKVETSATS